MALINLIEYAAFGEELHPHDVSELLESLDEPEAVHAIFDHWDPNVFLAALLVGIAALVIVSLLTAPEPANATSSLFGRLDASSDDEADRPLLLVHLLRLRAATRKRGWRTFREDLGGFAVGCLMVLVLVGATAIFLAM